MVNLKYDWFMMMSLGGGLRLGKISEISVIVRF